VVIPYKCKLGSAKSCLELYKPSLRILYAREKSKSLLQIGYISRIMYRLLSKTVHVRLSVKLW